MNHEEQQEFNFPWGLLLILIVLFFGFKLTMGNQNDSPEDVDCGCSSPNLE